MGTYDESISFAALYAALKKCQRGVMWKNSVAGYSLNGLKNCYTRRQELLTGKYKLSRYQRFMVKEPKPRDILATYITDRHVQRAMNDVYLIPHIAKSFIYDNVACQQNKGTPLALKRLKKFLQEYYRKYGTDGSVLQCDIKGYFPNTEHVIAQKKLVAACDDMRAAARAGEVIESYCEAEITDEFIKRGFTRADALQTAHYIASQRCEIYRARIENKSLTVINAAEDRIKKRCDIIGINDAEFIRHLISDKFKGIALGSQLSQITQLLILDRLDHIIKEQLKIKYYIRYMDDFILIHCDKQYLIYCRKVIEEYLKTVHLQLNQKTKLYELKQGIFYINWRYIITPTGKVIMKMTRKKITRQRRKMRKLAAMYKSGERSLEDIENNFRSWQSGAEMGNTYNQIVSMRKYYTTLIGRRPPNGSKYFKKRPTYKQSVRENSSGNTSKTD